MSVPGGVCLGGVCSGGECVCSQGGVCSLGCVCSRGVCVCSRGSAPGGVSAPGEVSAPGVCLLPGCVCLLQGVCPWGMSAPREVSAPGACLLPGGVCSGGCLVQEVSALGVSAGGHGIPACTEADTPPPCGQTDACKNITFATSLRTVKGRESEWRNFILLQR